MIVLIVLAVVTECYVAAPEPTATERLSKGVRFSLKKRAREHNVNQFFNCTKYTRDHSERAEELRKADWEISLQWVMSTLAGLFAPSSAS